MNPQHSKFALLKNYNFDFPKMKTITLHSFHNGRLRTNQSPERKMPKLKNLTFQSTLIVRQLQPRCRQKKAQMRTISLNKINNTAYEHRALFPLNQSYDIKGWSQKSAMEVFDL